MRAVRCLRQRWCWENRYCCRASRRAAAATSVVLQGRAIGGPNPTRPLPPAQSGLPAALAACSSVYVRRGAIVRGALRGPRARREGVPAADGRQRGGGVCGPPQAAHAGGASAASGAAEGRSANRVGRLVHHCRLQMSALRGVLWRHRSLVYVVAFYP
jgi:hypothetical protein